MSPDTTTETQFYHCGQKYTSSPAAKFTHCGHSYEARILRLCRGMMAAYVYDHTADHEAVESREDMWCFNATVTLPYGIQFEVAQQMGDWTTKAPMVRALGISQRVA